MSKRKRVLVIGLGQIGMGYDLRLDPAIHVYTHARAFSSHEAFELAGGVDPDPERRRMFEEEFGRPSFAEPASALTCTNSDIVVIASPTSLHATLVRETLELATPATILCEKPLSYELHEAEAMVLRCAERGVRLYVNYMRRADPGVIEVKRRLMSQNIATPLKGICWYSKGFVHNGSHFFNLLENWFGPMRAFSIIDEGRLLNGDEPEPDVRVSFQHGVVDFVAAKEENFSHYTIELISPTGRLRYEQGGRLIQWQRVIADPYIAGYRVLAEPEIIPSGRDRSQWHVAEELAAAIDDGNCHLCTGAEALTTLKSMTQINNAR